MRPTENVAAYTFAHPEAKRILRVVFEQKPLSFEDLRSRVRLHPETFHRVLRRLAGFDLVRIHAERGAKVQNSRIPVVVDKSEKTGPMVDLLNELDRVLSEYESVLGQRVVREMAAL